MVTIVLALWTRSYQALIAGTVALRMPGLLLASLPMFGVRLTAHLRVLWRPGHVGGGEPAARGLAGNSTPLFDAGRLLVAASAGCLTYLLMMVLLYLIAGKPMGTERLLLDRIGAWRQRPADL